MALVRVKLDFTIDVPGDRIPNGLPERVYDFVEGGLEAVGVVGEGRSVGLLPGSRMSASLARAKRRKGAP